MGAGNPLLRSFDPELYQDKTYYIDFVKATDSKDDDDYLAAQDHLDFFKCLDFIDISFDFSDDVHKELSGESRGFAVVLAQFEHGMLLSTSDSEINHYAIGMVPNFKYEDICDEMEEKFEHRKSWYEIRKISYHDAINRYASSAYRKRLKLFKQEARKVMSNIRESYAEYMTVRCGAWTSGKVNKIEL